MLFFRVKSVKAAFDLIKLIDKVHTLRTSAAAQVFLLKYVLNNQKLKHKLEENKYTGLFFYAE